MRVKFRTNQNRIVRAYKKAVKEVQAERGAAMADACAMLLAKRPGNDQS